MAGAKIIVEIDDVALRSALNNLGAAADGLSTVMRQIANYLVNSTQDRFDDGVAPDGSKWPQSIRSRLTGDKTLIDRGNLRDSIDRGKQSGTNFAEISSNEKYAAIHQFGGIIKAKQAGGLKFKIGEKWSRKKQVTIPARPYLGVNQEDQDEIADIINDWLVKALGSEGLR